MQQTTVRLRPKSLTLARPQLAAADSLRIPAFRYFWGSFGLTSSPLWVGLVNGLPGVAIDALPLAGGVLVDWARPRAVLLPVRLTMTAAMLPGRFTASRGVVSPE